MSKDKILALLPALNRDDLSAVIAVASALLGDQPMAIGAGGTEVANLVFDAISAALNRSWRAEIGVLPPTVQNALTEKVPPLLNFFNHNFKGWDETKTLKVAFTREMMRMLKDYLVEAGVKPTYLIMVRNLQNTGKAFDAYFPGYLASGLGTLYVKRLRSR